MNDPMYAVAVRTEELANEILSYGKNVLMCCPNESVYYDIPSRKKIHIAQEHLDTFFNDLDVAEYVPDKGVYKVYNANSIENALVLSDKCNSSCVMCPYSDHYRRDAGKVYPERVLKLIEYILTYPEHFTITGGEPTIIGEGIFDIMGFLKERFPKTEYLFLSNGRIFSESEYFERMVAVLPPYTCFAIPLYGDSPQTHDRITRAEGSFIQAVRGMQNFMNAGVSVEIRIVVSKLNYDNLSNVARFISKYLNKAFTVNFVGLEMCGNAARNRDRVWIDYSEAFSSMKEAVNILCENNIRVGIYNFPLCSVERGYWHLCKKSISDYKIVYYDECEKCEVKEICGGIFKSTYMLEKPEVKPVN